MFKLPVVMRLILLILILLTAQGVADELPVYWQYPGPFAQRLEDAFTKVKTARDSHHLIAESDRRGYIRKQLKKVKVNGCLEDQSTCSSEPLAILESFGIAGRVLATAKA